MRSQIVWDVPSYPCTSRYAEGKQPLHESFVFGNLEDGDGVIKSDCVEVG